MRRALSVVLLAVFTAAVSGVHEVSGAGQDRSQADGDAPRQEVARRLAEMPIGSPLEIETVRGGKVQAILESVAPDVVTVRLVSGSYTLSRTIPLDEIKSVRRIRRVGGISTGTKVGIGVVVGLGVAVGVCSAALGSETSSPGSRAESSEPTSRRPDATR